MVVKNTSKQCVLCSNCKVANSFISRFIGLMGRKNLEQGNGLIIVPCNSIHTFFMKFPIDVVFIDRNNTVVRLVENIKPWKISRVVWKAHSAIELPPGTISSTGTETGDRIELA